jgi:hypothetical protein
MIRIIIRPNIQYIYTTSGILCYINTSGVYCYFLENMINIKAYYTGINSFLLSMILCIPYIDLVPIIFWELETTVYRTLELERATILA